ncbi:MAG: DUF1080 domain-containing protein [Bacteroidales bacterium]|nr:DUF1080 domain-containing protein [Bacteroidales bacterium]
MKKIMAFAAMAALVLVTSCGGKKKAPACENIVVPAHDNVPEYTIVNAPQVDLADFQIDEEGYYVIFNGKDFTGWRGYGKDRVPSKWVIEDGAIKFEGKGGGEAQKGDGGDIIFTKKFKNFILEFEWKVAKRANSGVFYLAQEVTTKKEDGTEKYEHIYLSAPEYQILDNENHPDSFLGVNGNRKSASLYDMIPAVPQNAKPFGEWNTARILVFQGTVVHGQNGENVLEYHLWTPEWTDMLQASKFSHDKWPIAFDLLNDCGGPEHEGYIGLQDHGDVVWYRNIRVKLLDEE